MEYKLSSFQFSQDIGRQQKHHIIKKINGVRSKCPSDAKFAGQFDFNDGMLSGEIKVLFSKGNFFVSGKGSCVEDLMRVLINELDDQVTVWKEIRFDQSKSFIDYSQPIQKKASGS